MMTEDSIRVLVVDDAVIYRKLVSDLLASMPGVEVVGMAANGRIALQKIEQLRPDLVTLDLEMPEIDGLEVLRRLRHAGDDVGVIMLSGTTAQGASSTMAALALGAFDFVLKPACGTREENTAMLYDKLRPRIQAFARARHVRKILHGDAPAAHHGPLLKPDEVAHRPALAPAGGVCHPEVVALGISTGGPAALTRMLPKLPADLAAPVLIVQHMPPVFTKSLADDLDRRCALNVCEASEGQVPVAGQVLIAPGGKQMKIERAGRHLVVRMTDDPPENSCRPSVDYLFRSVSRACGRNAVGVIMTGMGNDGSRGCREMKERGASIVAQDEATSVVFGMPKGPIEEGIVDVVAPLDFIAVQIVRLVGRGAQACE